MQKVYALFGVLFVLVAPFWYGAVLLDDLAHPERWNRDRTRDPRIYAPATAGVGLVGAALCVRLRRKGQRDRRRFAELDGLIKRVRQLQAARRWEEAEQLIRRIEALWHEYGLDRLRPLRESG